MEKMYPYKAVDLSFFDHAPFRMGIDIEMHASPERLLEVLAGDVVWTEWAPGLNKVEWRTPKPFAADAKRRVFMSFNSIIDELPSGSDYIGFAAGAEEQFSEETKTFFRIFNRKRSEKDYKVKLIANQSARKSIEHYEYEKGQKKPEYRFVQGIAFNGIIIFGDKVLQVAFEEEPVAVIISSKVMADSFRKVFHSYWKIGKR